MTDSPEELLDPVEAPFEVSSETEPLPKTVLIVEDDEANAEVLSLRLERQGFQTILAHTGHEGLRTARAQKPHLVLLDLQLPDQSGLEVCQELADEPATACIPVIVLSGMCRPDIIRRSRAAGCQFYVRKPYDPNVLLILIRQALEEAQGTGPV